MSESFRESKPEDHCTNQFKFEYARKSYLSALILNRNPPGLALINFPTSRRGWPLHPR
jgi:hypothetical protein